MRPLSISYIFAIDLTCFTFPLNFNKTLAFSSRLHRYNAPNLAVFGYFMILLFAFIQFCRYFSISARFYNGLCLIFFANSFVKVKIYQIHFNFQSIQIRQRILRQLLILSI